jgi:hypothetical protein
MTQKDTSADIAGLAATLSAAIKQLDRIEGLVGSCVSKEQYNRDYMSFKSAVEQCIASVDLLKIEQQKQVTEFQIAMNALILKFTEAMYGINLKLATYSGAAGVIIWGVQYAINEWF